ncbi:hypothetical protein HY636_03785 [Candidatus Woesearchaeota archaeon]|nr:hypothetical protein [Candidatus Woesearchaeota archaeon]
MKTKTIQEVKSLYHSGKGPCENHVSPKEIVEGFTTLFLGFPYENINFHKLKLSSVIKQVGADEVDDCGEIDGLSETGLGRVLRAVHTHLRGLNFDKEDIVYHFGFKEYSSQKEADAAEKYFFAKLNGRVERTSDDSELDMKNIEEKTIHVKPSENNFLARLVKELSEALDNFNQGNNGEQYFRRVLFSNTFPSLNCEDVAEEERSFLGLNPPLIFPNEEISCLEKLLGEWYSSEALKSAGIVLLQKPENPPLKFLEKFSKMKGNNKEDVHISDYISEFKKHFPDLASTISIRVGLGLVVDSILWARKDKEKALSEYSTVYSYFEGKVLEDELRVKIKEMKNPYSRLYARRALLERFFGYDGETQFRIGVPEKLFSDFLEDLNGLGRRSLIALEGLRTNPNANNYWKEHYQAPSAIIEMYNQAIHQWDSASGYQSVRDVVTKYAQKAVKQRDLFMAKFLVFKLGDVFAQTGGCSSCIGSPSSEPWQRDAYDSFLGAQTLLNFSSSKKYVNKIVELFGKVSKYK